ncbi:MAG: hypothetical protein ACKODX_06585 [Gemmata sp.]
MIPLENGGTEITARAGGQQVTFAVEEVERKESINFANEIVPIFTTLGCNAGACHGKTSVQNGFRLSLLGGAAIEPVVAKSTGADFAWRGTCQARGAERQYNRYLVCCGSVER